MHWVTSHSAIVVLLLIVIAICVICACVGGANAYRSSVLRRGGIAIAVRQRTANIRQLVANDPMFDESGFYSRVEAAFYKIQDAWCAQNLKEVQLFLSDGTAERYLLQFAEQRDEDYREQMESIRRA
jgi:predicted lipid-binding transport protein (Tim44 family)